MIGIEPDLRGQVERSADTIVAVLEEEAPALVGAFGVAETRTREC